jgi:hypothetical protein
MILAKTIQYTYYKFILDKEHPFVGKCIVIRTKNFTTWEVMYKFRWWDCTTFRYIDYDWRDIMIFTNDPIKVFQKVSINEFFESQFLDEMFIKATLVF